MHRTLIRKSIRNKKEKKREERVRGSKEDGNCIIESSMTLTLSHQNELLRVGQRVLFICPWLLLLLFQLKIEIKKADKNVKLITYEVGK